MNEQELYGQLGALTKRKEAWRDAIPFVGALLETPSPKITAKALWLLGEMGLKHPGEVAPFAAKIASFLDSPDGQLRERALNALGRIGRARFETVKPHWDKMTGLAADGNPRVRLAFIWASENVATNTPDPYRDCLPLFAALLHDPDDRVRMEAPEMFRVLGKRRPCFVEPYLETLQALALRDPHPVVRIHSAGAVRAVKGRESCVGQEQPSRPDPGVPPLAGSPPSMEYDLLTPGRAAADPAIRALYESAFPEEERIPWTDLLRLVRDMPLEFAVYRDGDGLAGFTIVYPRPRLSWFWYFAVPPEKRGRGVGQRIFATLLARYEGRSAVLDMEDPAQPGAPNPGQRRRRAAFYLRNGFRETGVGRVFGPVAMTILLKGDDTFTAGDYDQLLSEIFRFWKPG